MGLGGFRRSRFQGSREVSGVWGLGASGVRGLEVFEPMRALGGCMGSWVLGGFRA